MIKPFPTIAQQNIPAFPNQRPHSPSQLNSKTDLLLGHELDTAASSCPVRYDRRASHPGRILMIMDVCLLAGSMRVRIAYGAWAECKGNGEGKGEGEGKGKGEGKERAGHIHMIMDVRLLAGSMRVRTAFGEWLQGRAEVQVKGEGNDKAGGEGKGMGRGRGHEHRMQDSQAIIARWAIARKLLMLVLHFYCTAAGTNVFTRCIPPHLPPAPACRRAACVSQAAAPRGRFQAAQSQSCRAWKQEKDMETIKALLSHFTAVATQSATQTTSNTVTRKNLLTLLQLTASFPTIVQGPPSRTWPGSPPRQLSRCRGR